MNNATRSHDATDVMYEYREGVDLYTRDPSTETERVMLEQGRAAELAYLTKFCTPGAANKAVYMGVVAKGNEQLDRFRVIHSTLNGFVPPEERLLLARYDSVESGESNRIRFVTMAHRRYDKRLSRFDLTRKQCCVLLVLVLLIGLLMAFAYDMHRVASLPNSESLVAKLIVAAVNDGADTPAIDEL